VIDGQEVSDHDDDRDPCHVEGSQRARVGCRPARAAGRREASAWLDRRPAPHSARKPQQARVLIGTWQTRADWEVWHTDLAFAETRKRLEGLEATPREEWWHEVVLDMFKGFRAPVELRGITRRLGNARERLAAALTPPRPGSVQGDGEPDDGRSSGKHYVTVLQTTLLEFAEADNVRYYARIQGATSPTSSSVRGPG